jgi:hypothetical protein
MKPISSEQEDTMWEGGENTHVFSELSTLEIYELFEPNATVHHI